MSKSTFVHAIPARFTSRISVPIPSIPSRPGNARNQSGSRPTEISAPRVMSPEMPLNGCRIPIGMSGAVRRSDAGVENDDFGVGGNAPVVHHDRKHSQRRTSFRRCVDAGLAADLSRRRSDLVFAHRDRIAMALSHRVENETDTKRTWHTQP